MHTCLYLLPSAAPIIRKDVTASRDPRHRTCSSLYASPALPSLCCLRAWFQGKYKIGFLGCIDCFHAAKESPKMLLGSCHGTAGSPVPRGSNTCEVTHTCVLICILTFLSVLLSSGPSAVPYKCPPCKLHPSRKLLPGAELVLRLWFLPLLRRLKSEVCTTPRLLNTSFSDLYEREHSEPHNAMSHTRSCCVK